MGLLGRGVGLLGRVLGTRLGIFLGNFVTRSGGVLLGRVEGNRKWEIWEMDLLGRVTDYSAGHLCSEI